MILPNTHIHTHSKHTSNLLFIFWKYLFIFSFLSLFISWGLIDFESQGIVKSLGALLAHLSRSPSPPTIHSLINQKMCIDMYFRMCCVRVWSYLYIFVWIVLWYKKWVCMSMCVFCRVYVCMWWKWYPYMYVHVYDVCPTNNL